MRDVRNTNLSYVPTKNGWVDAMVVGHGVDPQRENTKNVISTRGLFADDVAILIEFAL